MRRIVLLILITVMLCMPVSALEITAPPVPESGRKLMPDSGESFGEGLLEVLRDALCYFHPDLKEAAGICCSVVLAVMIVSVLQSLPGSDGAPTDLAGAITVSLLLLRSSSSLINLGTDTVTQIYEYGKMLLPVMTSAVAMQGGVTTATALYTGTAFFSSLLAGLISKVLVPMIYLYLALCVASGAMGNVFLQNLSGTAKWTMTWVLKIILYIFTGYISITGVVSGTTDAAALKAAKLTISGVVPVVGGILSDASEAVLVGAATVKNAAGIYGLLAIAAVVLGPFLRIGAHYLLLKLAAGICGLFGSKRITGLIENFSGAMGFVLAVVGTACLMLMISTVCFMKGVA